MESRCSCLAFGILLFAGCSQTFPVQDRAQLAAYIAYEIVSKEGPVPDTPPPDSDVCPECNGTGEVGDGTVMFPCSFCGGTGKVKKQEMGSAPPPKPSMPVVEPPKAAMPVAKPKVSYQTGPHWNVEGKWNYTTLELADHLRTDHGVNINGLTRSQLEQIHDAIHNGLPVPTFSRSTTTTKRVQSSCPTGNCPLR